MNRARLREMAADVLVLTICILAVNGLFWIVQHGISL